MRLEYSSKPTGNISPLIAIFSQVYLLDLDQIRESDFNGQTAVVGVYLEAIYKYKLVPNIFLARRIVNHICQTQNCQKNMPLMRFPPSFSPSSRLHSASVHGHAGHTLKMLSMILKPPFS